MSNLKTYGLILLVSVLFTCVVVVTIQEDVESVNATSDNEIEYIVVPESFGSVVSIITDRRGSHIILFEHGVLVTSVEYNVPHQSIWEETQ